MISTLTKLFFRMTERLTDEQLRAWRDRRDPNLRTPTPPHSESVVPLIDDILALRARVAKLEAALEEADKELERWGSRGNVEDLRARIAALSQTPDAEKGEKR